MARQIPGEDRMDTAFRMQIQGEVYRLMGRYEQVVTTYRDHYGPRDSRTQAARDDLASLYTAWSKPGEAASYAISSSLLRR